MTRIKAITKSREERLRKRALAELQAEALVNERRLRLWLAQDDKLPAPTTEKGTTDAAAL